MTLMTGFVGQGHTFALHGLESSEQRWCCWHPRPPVFGLGHVTSSAWIAFVQWAGGPIFGCSLTQIWSNGQGKFRQLRTEWWPWSSQIPSIVFPAKPCLRAQAGPATAGGWPPADEFSKQVTAYKCHLKPFVMTAYGFQELHSQLQPANIPFLVDNEIPLALESYCVHSKCRLYLILQIPVKLRSMWWCP